MKLLALDTATEACSAALYVDGEVTQRFELAPRRHAALILPMLDSLLNEDGFSHSQLDAVAFGRGPGAFTGVRIAVGVAQGVAFGAALPVVPISSLAALAHGGFRTTGQRCVLAAMDARMGQLYWGVYRAEALGHVIGECDECVAAPEQVPLPDKPVWYGAGTGWGTHGAALRSRLGERLSGSDPAVYPSAEDVAHLAATAFATGEALPADHALPVYLRDQVAKKSAPK